ncbi:MAG: riboflavin synthase [Thermostichales cyanobacterium SZTDM-1c_bins_54]
MFTGLVHTTGSLRPWQGDQVLIIPDQDLGELALGDSVAVDGVCLTVAGLMEGGFLADLSPETRRRSTLGCRRRVNLEPSLRVGEKLGGHFVTGHIDGVGELLGREATGSAWELRFGIPAALWPYVVPKGSIAINGVSLTIANLQEMGQEMGQEISLTVAVIPHTYHQTTLADLAIGDPVNLEADILGKYVHKLLGSRFQPEVSLAFLQEHGYL